jgi:hypothetical protein
MASGLSHDTQSARHAAGSLLSAHNSLEAGAAIKAVPNTRGTLTITGSREAGGKCMDATMVEPQKPWRIALLEAFATTG